jgi:hypothetical protein
MNVVYCYPKNSSFECDVHNITITRVFMVDEQLEYNLNFDVKSKQFFPKCILGQT